MSGAAPGAVTAGPLALSPPELRAAYALYFADEALSSVRHDVLNRLTALGAISYELRARAAEAVELHGRGHSERIADLNRQIALLSQTVSRRLSPGRDPGACTRLTPALRAAVAACPRPEAVRLAGPGERDPEVRGTAVEVALMFLALLDNACQAAARVIDVRWASEGEAVQVQVSDDGEGLASEARERALERFFTTKPGHAGLGLSLARTLVVRLGGELQLAALPSGGTRVTLTLRPPGEGGSAAPDGEGG